MRFRDIQNSYIRNSALSQYADQLGINQAHKHRLKNCYLAFLDYAKTVEGFDYWNKIRPLHLLKIEGYRENVKQIYYRHEKKYYISERFRKLLTKKNKTALNVAEKLGYTEYIIKKALGGKRVGLRFIDDLCVYFKIDRSELIGSNDIDRFEKPKPPKPRKDQTTKIPKGTKRVCSICKKEKDLSKEFNNFKYGKLGKSNNCKICNRARQKEYKKKARLKKLKK